RGALIDVAVSSNRSRSGQTPGAPQVQSQPDFSTSICTKIRRFAKPAFYAGINVRARRKVASGQYLLPKRFLRQVRACPARERPSMNPATQPALSARTPSGGNNLKRAPILEDTSLPPDGQGAFRVGRRGDRSPPLVLMAWRSALTNCRSGSGSRL